jgi:hypothetical protein
MNLDDVAKKLAQYILALKDFKFVSPEIPYNHMGATITDAILQSGLNYKTVVKPRVDEILQKYSEAKTTTAFQNLLKKTGVSKVLRWKNKEKPNRIIALTNLLSSEGIETEGELKLWLQDEKHLALLDGVRGVGNKTIDYLKLLSGIQTSAIDRHLLRFISEAGICVRSYPEAREIVNRTADLIGKERALLDHSLWKYMSEKFR